MIVVVSHVIKISLRLSKDISFSYQFLASFEPYVSLSHCAGLKSDIKWLPTGKVKDTKLYSVI